jgi:hypothetical protein
MATNDVIDELMPDPEEEGGTQDDIEIEIADGAEGGGVRVPDEEGAEAGTEDEGVRLAEEEGEELSPEDKKYSKNVQDRIKREQRLRRRQVETERQAREASDARAVAAEARVLEAERQTVEARLLATGVLVRGLESEIGSLTDKITSAKEGGKTEDEVKLQRQLNDAQANLREAQTNHGRLEEAKKNPPRPAAAAANPYSATWLSGNTWFNDPEFSGDAGKAREIDAKMMKEGKFSPRTAEYFKELDKRLHDDLPRLRTKVRTAGLATSFTGTKTPPDTRREARNSPVLPAQPRQSNAEQPKSKTKVVLTTADMENMRNFKMDPTNPKHLQRYAREKIAQGD